MALLNREALQGRRRVTGDHSRSFESRNLQPRVAIHGLSGPGKPDWELPMVHVPAGRVDLPSGQHEVGDFYLTHPVRVGHVQAWAWHDGKRPWVHFAMETAKSPHQPGELHVVQRGPDGFHMGDFDPILAYDLDAARGEVELVGHPMDVLTRYLALERNPEDVMTGFSLYEQTALGNFLTRMSATELAAAHLGALTMVSEAQIVHASFNHARLFKDSQKLPGMPSFIGHWLRDFGNPDQLGWPAEYVINAWRLWRGGDINHENLPVTVRSDGNRGPINHSDYTVARFAVLPLP